MAVAAASRNRLANTLQEAYAAGLISERTLSMRLDEILHSRIVKPDRLVGDLHLRPSEQGLRDRVSHTMHTVADLFGSLRVDSDGAPVDLLGLDWSSEPMDLIIGRSSSCDIVLEDPSVSRRHARLIRRDWRWVLQDLGSTNGTHLNGTRVGRCELRPGDGLELGSARLRVD